MIIRAARVDDAPHLVSAERAVAAQPGLLASRPEELLEESFRATINKRDVRYVVAEREGEIVGHANLVPMALASTRHIVRLTIVVHPGNEGQGVGKQLMTSLIDWARLAPAVRKIELNVRSTNTRAIGLYRSLGFEEEARHLDRICIDEHTFLDDLELGLFVKPR